MFKAWQVVTAVVVLAVGVAVVSFRSNPPAAPSVWGFEVLEKLPHDRTAYTQGLVFQDGYFYESTGQYGRSDLRKTVPSSGVIVRERDLAPELFGEGLTFYKGVLVQITWQAGRGFVYNAESFELMREFRYEGQGWGLTHDGETLIMSDGSHTLRFLNYQNLRVERTLQVRALGQPVGNLNELEWVKGEIWANIYQSNRIARIDPQTGKVRGWIDLSGILASNDRHGREDVLNGIAYDPASDALYVTGKNYGYIYRIAVQENP